MTGKCVLLVEDNAKDEALTLRALRKVNIANEVVVVRDGAEALDYLGITGTGQGRSEIALPAVVMLDLKLPKIDGLEVLRRIRAHEWSKVLPVVILTSSGEPRDLAEGYAAGANSYVRKPVEFTEFAHAVGKLGLYWLIVNEPPVVKRS